MAKPCSICIHPKRSAIEADRASGASYRTLADRYQIAETNLKRHCASHAPHLAEVDRTAAKRPTPPPPHARVQGETMPDTLRPAIQAAFLAAFVELANESGACDAVQIDRSTVRYWEEHDTDHFTLRYQDAKERVNDAIRGEINRRARYGVPEPVVSAGKVMRNDDGSIMTVQKYSDTLLLKLAGARMPEFREKQQVELFGKDGGPIQTQTAHTLDLRSLSDMELAAVKRALEAATGET